MALAIADAGPLVAMFDRKDRYHEWVGERVRELRTPLLVCEPVVVEAMYLLRHQPAAMDGLFAGMELGAFRIAFHVDDHLAAVRHLHARYRDRPMSLADACIVRMAELNEQHAVFTLDSDFLFYRKNGNVPLNVIYPARQ
jgi:predicted nucleic acid-binding protein